VLDLIGKRRYGYALSVLLVLPGLLFIVATLIPNGNVGLQFSIAYTGGTVWEVHFEDGTPDPLAVRAVLEEQGLAGSEVAITSSDERDYVLIRTAALTLQQPEVVEGSAAAALAAAQASALPGTSPAPAGSAAPGTSPAPAGSVAPAASAEPEATDAAASPSADPSLAPVAAATDGEPVIGIPTEGQFGELATALQAEFGPIDEVRQENSVGPVVSAELVEQTVLLILMAAAVIMLWVSYRFRDFRMGVTTVVALLHDVVIVTGVFALLGTFIGLQIDALFVTAMLTVIGYSVHDTIVVFDRIRENRQRYPGEPLERITNYSLVQTVGRSITTGLTVALTLLALLFFGGEAIRPFPLALLIGVTAGTFSSLFVATPLFLDWHLWDDRRMASRPLEAKVKSKTSTA
jgi:preprotein translocase SecF subunit